jgi:hypothetical protein
MLRRIKLRKIQGEQLGNTVMDMLKMMVRGDALKKTLSLMTKDSILRQRRASSI